MKIFYIDYFFNIINKIDLRREEIKLDIDTYYDKMINELKQAQIDCLFMSEANKKVSFEELKFFKKEVKSFNKDLRYVFILTQFKFKIMLTLV